MKKGYKISLLISGVATAVGSGAMGVMLNYIVAEYALEGSREGLMSSFISAGALIALLVGILLRGKIPKTGFIIFGGLLMSGMLTCKGIPILFPLFLAICLLMGFGMGMMDTFQSAFLSDLSPQNTARDLGLFHGIFGVGGVMLPLVLQRLLSRYSWRTVYVIMGCFCGGLVLQFMAATFVMRKEPVLKKLENSQSFFQMKEFLKAPYFCLLLLCMFVGAAGQNGILVWTVRYVSNTLGDTVLAPVCLSVYWISSTISRILAPRLPIPPMRLLAAGSAVSGIAWGIGILAGTSKMVLAACIVTGLTSGCCIPLLLNEGAGFSRSNTGLITSVLMLVKTAGQMLTPIFISMMQEMTGTKAAIFIIGLIFILDSAIAAIMIQMKPQSVCS